MSDNTERVWRLIDPATGDFDDYAGCPDCVDKDAVIEKHERQIRILSAKVSRLEGRREREDRESKLWAEAEQVFTWWALATGHEGSKFSHERFKQIAPRLKERRFGPIDVLKGIAGAAFDAGERPRNNGSIERFDDIELVCRADHKLENFQERVYGGAESEAWKRWLIDRIESNLSE
jgi:hypothetical protein